MTVASFGGPFLIGMILRGGEHPEWPPDRPVEWVAFAGGAGLVVVLLIGLGAIGIMNMKELQAAQRAARLAKRPPTTGDDA